MKRIVFGTVVLLCMSFVNDKISPRLQQKLHNAVATSYEIEEFELTPLEATLGEDHLFTISSAEGQLGFAYLGRAASMKEMFDYVVLLTPELEIKKAKVLIYRENHGRQIGSQRWLKQFIGKGSGDSLEYGGEIDAISGATISAKSMTKAVKEVLNKMEALHTKGAI